MAGIQSGKISYIIIQLIPHFTFMGDDRRPAPANREQILAIKNALYLPQYFTGN